MKKILCIVLAATIFASTFAQNSDLEKISLDFAERLIHDGANLERLEKFSQNQQENGAVYSKKNRKLDETLQRVSQNLSEESKEHLEKYRELDKILQKSSKIKKNRTLISEKAEQFSPDEREDLYFLNAVENRTWFWNIFPLPGFGLGSFGQGDVPGGLLQLAGLGLSGIFLSKGVNSHGSDQDFFMGAFACTFIATPFIIGTIRPIFFKSSRNAMLRKSLGLNSKGKALAQSPNASEIQLSFAPIVNPVASQYGAVALIHF